MRQMFRSRVKFCVFWMVIPNLPFVDWACFVVTSKVFNQLVWTCFGGSILDVGCIIYVVITVAFWSQEGLELGEQKANSKLSPGQEQRKNLFLVRSLDSEITVF